MQTKMNSRRRGFAWTMLAFNALLVLPNVLSATLIPVASFDVNASANATATQVGFTTITDGGLTTFSATDGGVTMQVTFANAANDRDRLADGTLTGNPNAALLRDFVFDSNLSATPADALRTRLTGLAANTEYRLRVHSYDADANNNTVSLWTTGAATTLNGSDPAFLLTHQTIQTRPDAGYFDVDVTTDGSGSITLLARGSTAATASSLVVLNGIEVLQQVSPVRDVIKVDVNHTNTNQGTPQMATEAGFLALNPINFTGSVTDPNSNVTVTVTSDRTDNPTRNRNNTGEALYSDFIFSNAVMTVDIDGLTVGKEYELTIFSQDTDGNTTHLSAWFLDGSLDAFRSAHLNINDENSNRNAWGFTTNFTATDTSVTITGREVPGRATTDLIFFNGLILRDVSAIPEPATATLGLIGLGGLMMRRRRMA